jgi:anti-sigma factor RsiW
MNTDPVQQKLRETAWRRPLTEVEQRELQAWLAAHPELQAEAELDAALDAALEHRPPPQAASNFTARVLQAIETDVATKRTPVRHRANWWQVFIPRFAVATLLIGGGALWYRHHDATRQEELAAAARQLATARTLSHPAVIEDFEVIRGLSPAMAVADEGLLALSDELLALEK